MITTRTIPAQVWISDGTPDEYWCEGQAAIIQIERTDTNEIRIGTHLGQDATETAGMYLTLHYARELIVAIAQAVGE